MAPDRTAPAGKTRALAFARSGGARPKTIPDGTRGSTRYLGGSQAVHQARRNETTALNTQLHSRSEQSI